MMGKDGYSMFNASQVVRKPSLSGQAMILDLFEHLGGESSSDQSSANKLWSSMYTSVVTRAEFEGQGIAPKVEGRIVQKARLVADAFHDRGSVGAGD